MSREFTMTRGPAAEAAHHNWLAYAWSAVSVVVLVAGIFLAAHVMSELHAMSTSLTTVTARLGALEAMDRKLNTLNGMSSTLKDMNGKLALTNRALQQSNAKLSSMNAQSTSAGVSLRGMKQGLTAMRSDIHAMVHKISGSFLFRSVK